MTNLQEDIPCKSTDDLRQKILDTAEELFANKGFKGTSIREITERANCNIASINYYFQGK